MILDSARFSTQCGPKAEPEAAQFASLTVPQRAMLPVLAQWVAVMPARVVAHRARTTYNGPFE
jgi:hypothetical protein